MALQSLLDQAKAARLADDYPTAKRLARAVIAAGGDQPEAESLLGVCEVETGEVGAGAPLIERAAAARPDSPWIAINLCLLREAQGDLRNAVVAASRAVSLAPDRFECWTALGKALGAAGKYVEAHEALSRAFALNPDHAGVAMLLAGAAIEADRYDDAERALACFERVAAGTPQALAIRVNLSRKIGDWAGLEAAAADWLALAPADETARGALAHALSQQGYYDRAAQTYAPLLQSDPSADKYAVVGRMFLGARRLDAAERAFDRALELDPENAEAAFGAARLCLFRGDLDAAESRCRRAVALAPQNADALAMLAELTGGRLSDDELAAAETVAATSAEPAAARAAASFAVGDARHRRKEREAAFAAWTAANEIKRAQARLVGGDYDAASQEALTRRIMTLFPEDPGADGAEPRGATPIFIVGMPRSGTTLLETALAAHGEVASAGEVPALPHYFDAFIDWAATSGWSGGPLPEAVAAEWIDGYLAQRTLFAEGSGRFVTDKQPTNFLAAGLIRLLFPDAPIICIRRNPVDVGFSIFRRNFTQQWPFTTSLEAIGHYSGQQARLCAWWAATLGPRFVTVQYERLVADFEPELRRVVDACGLDWDPACLDYRNRERSVMTFSAAQVRKPLGAVEREAGAYRDQLEPLVRALAAADVDLETGAYLGAI